MKFRLIMIICLVFTLSVPMSEPVGAASSFPATETLVKNTVKKYPKLSLYYQNLVTGEVYSYQPTKVMQAASTIKLPLVLYVYDLVAKRQLSLTEKLTYRSHHTYGGSGVIQKDRVGSAYTIQDLVYKAITYSDNIAFIMLRERVGKEEFIQYAKSLGGKVIYPSGRNMTTASDMASYLRKLWEFKGKQPELGGELLKMLSNTIYKNTVATSLKPEQVAHKVGYIPANLVYNDVQLVQVEEPYILVVMTEGIPLGKDVQVISALATALHKDHVQQVLNRANTLLYKTQVAKSELVKQILVEYEADSKTPPYEIFNEMKKSLAELKVLLPSLPSEKKVYFQSQITELELWVTRGGYYIDAVSAGKKLTVETDRLMKALKNGNPGQAINSYYSLQSLQKRQATFLYKPYGKQTRENFLALYKEPAEKAIERGRVVVEIVDELARLKSMVKVESVTEANQQQIEQWLLEVQDAEMGVVLREWYEEILDDSN